MRFAIAMLALVTLPISPAMAEEPGRPWPAQYKIRPDQKDRLTPADVVGPDSVVYPNWRHTGVQGGIPTIPQAAKLEEFGGKAGMDISNALDQACRAVGQKGGGAVVIGEGTFYMDSPVTVRDSNVVIRGQGADKTKIIFRYSLPESGAMFYRIKPGDRVGNSTPVELQCVPAGLMKMSIQAGQTVLAQWERGKHSGNTFWLRSAWSAVSKLPNGPATLKGVGEYENGSRKTVEIGIIVEHNFKPATPVPDSLVAINFQGQGPTGKQLKLAKDGKRGDMRIELESVEGLAIGDRIVIEGPATERWKTLTQNRCLWGTYRRYELQVEKIEGSVLLANQPLRIEFPIIDGSFVQKTQPIQRCGIEDLFIEQTQDLWITTVQFTNAWNCWARGVEVRKCGRNPVYAIRAKWCEIRDCVFDDAWYKGGGGTAYTGWELCCDCLMENIETFNFRHAPLFQWAASGCVIRKGTFHASDAQWHSGWTNENLFEQCLVESKTGNGGYGNGMWASPPEDSAHGPNGPRNVVYNCDVTSPKTGLWMGGLNENWLILYNRFTVDKGPGVQAKYNSFDLIVKGNVFVLKDKTSPGVLLESADCPGVEIIANQQFGGNGNISGGKARPALIQDNKIFPAGQAQRPSLAVPSIYEWQNTRR